MFVVGVHFGPYTAEFTDKVPLGFTTSAYPAVISLDEFRFAQEALHGGRVSAQYGSLKLSPDAFVATNPALSAWPPVERLDLVTVQWIPDDGSTPFYLPSNFSGNLESANGVEIVYKLTPYLAYDDTERDKHYTGTLVDCFTAACATLGLTLNSSWDAIPSPEVDWIASGENLILDNLSNLAKFFNHRFFIDGSTLYLIGCQIPAIADIDLITSDMVSIEYFWYWKYEKYSTDYAVNSVNIISITVLDSINGSSVYISEFNVSKSLGGTMIPPSVAWASDYIPGYPVTNMVDGNTGTEWAGLLGETVGASVSSGGIAEYAITGSAFPDFTPTKWILYARDPYSGVDHQQSTVVSDAWTGGETRKFSVPETMTMTVPYPNPDGGKDEFKVSPSCHTEYYPILSAMEDIATEMLADNARVVMPIRQIKPGQQLNIYDSSTVPGETIRFDMLARDITYDFVAGTMVVEGARSPI